MLCLRMFFSEHPQIVTEAISQPVGRRSADFLRPFGGKPAELERQIRPSVRKIRPSYIPKSVKSVKSVVKNPVIVKFVAKNPVIVKSVAKKSSCSKSPWQRLPATGRAYWLCPC